MEIILAIIGSGVLTTLLTWLLNRADKKKEKEEKEADSDNDIREAVMYLMYNSINHAANDYLVKGYISSSELEVLIKMHACYHRMGGNGYLDSMMAAVKELVIK